MSVKSKVFAGVATLTLVGGVGAMGAMGATAANAATPSCGHSCVDLYSPLFGSYNSPNFVLDTYRQGAKIGQPIILFRAANNDPAEDFTFDEEGSVADFYAADLVTAALDLHYANYDAVEIQYTPYGVDTGLCVATTTTAGPGAEVGLEACGVSSKSVWVTDSTNPDYAFPNGTTTLINGSDTNFSDPYGLTYPANGYPTDTPRPQLTTEQILGFSRGQVNENQLWGARFGNLG